MLSAGRTSNSSPPKLTKKVYLLGKTCIEYNSSDLKQADILVERLRLIDSTGHRIVALCTFYTGLSTYVNFYDFVKNIEV